MGPKRHHPSSGGGAAVLKNARPLKRKRAYQEDDKQLEEGHNRKLVLRQKRPSSLTPRYPTAISLSPPATNSSSGRVTASTTDDEDKASEDKQYAAEREENAQFQLAQNRFFRSLDDEQDDLLRELKDRLGNHTLSKEERDKMIDRCQVLRRAMTDKYNTMNGKKSVQRGKTAITAYPETAAGINHRLLGDEERKHPWIVDLKLNVELPHHGMFFRVTDEASKAKFYYEKGLFSGGSESSLNTAEGRARDLNAHFNWGNRKRTEFISMESEVNHFFNKRVPQFLKRDEKCPGRDTVLIIGINGNSVRAAGLPILSARKEYDHYLRTREDAVDTDVTWLNSEQLCLFRVGIEHIYGVWNWETIRSYKREYFSGIRLEKWYTEVMKLAFKEHEAARKAGRAYKHPPGCICCHCSSVKPS